MTGYTIVMETGDDGGMVVSVPTLPGCFSQGDTREEAVQNVREAISVYLDEVRARGEECPREIRVETEFLERPGTRF